MSRNTIIHDNVQIGEGVCIGDFSIIYPNVTICDGTTIGPYCTIGEPTTDYYKSDAYIHEKTIIGANSIIRSHSIVYSGVTIGTGFQGGHRITIREEANIGNNVRIGTLSDIQGYCEIGSYVSVHSNVFIAQYSTICNYVWIFPHAVLTNDPTPPSNHMRGSRIEEFAVIAAGAVIMPGVVVGKDSLVGAGSLVRSNVSEMTVVAGNPAKEICSVEKIRNKVTGEPVYPWRYYFDRGMPWEGIGFVKWYESHNS